jgi:hypothetical protein
MGRVCSTNKGKKECVYVIGGKARKKETTSSTIRPRRRWVDNIEMDLGEIGWGAVEGWICLDQDKDHWRACKADNLNVICRLVPLQNVASSTSHNLIGLHGLLHGQRYLYLNAKAELCSNLQFHI